MSCEPVTVNTVNNKLDKSKMFCASPITLAIFASTAFVVAADLFNDPRVMEETMREAKMFERQFEVLVDPSDDFCFSFEMEPGVGHKFQYEFSVDTSLMT